MAASVAESARRGAAIFEDPELGTVSVRGADRKSWLNGLVTCEVAKVTPGVAAYGVAVVKIGRVLTDLWVVDAGERLLVGVRRDRIAKLRDHLEHYLIMEDVVHEDASAGLAWAHAHGPRAAALLGEVAPGHGGFAGAVDVTGLGGAVVVAPEAGLDALLAEAVQRGGGDAAIGTEAEWDELRVRRGLARFGVDYDDQNYPQEASLEKVAVSFNKGCYLGQEVVLRLEMRGHVSKKVVLLAVEGGGLPARGAEVTGDGHVVGAVTSAAPGEAGAPPVALAMVKYAFTTPGTKLSVAGREATVLSL